VQTTVVRTQATPPHHAAVYRWQQDGRDAQLVTATTTVAINKQPWLFPEPTQQLELPVVLPGYDFELRPDTLHPDSPLAARLAAPLPPSRLVRLDHASASTEQKIRSFLDVNCAACHRPGGIGRGLYDARATTPLDKQQLIDGPLLSGDLGVAGAKVVVPGHPERSMLVIRLKKPPGDPMRMPPACTSPATPPVLPLLESWIRELK
jgi:mono/diheme cytochrome c family protein